MLLFDATHTSHTFAQTGIQRVTRSLFNELARQQPVTGICHDPYQKVWRTLTPGEMVHLQPSQPGAGSRKSQWTFRQRFFGRWRRRLGLRAALPSASSFICPEFFSAKVGSCLPEIFNQVSGPRAAIFYDAIPLQYPELTPSGTVARYPAYLRELLCFDGVAAISENSAQILRDYWGWLGVTDQPPVIAIPLAITRHLSRDESAAAEPPTKYPRILCVCTIEGRKNHVALLDACAELWAQGEKFELELIGLAQPDTGKAALARIAKLQQVGRPLFYAGSVPDPALRRAYRRCAFTVYPSLIEGFGLPVLESLDQGKPCICSSRGALGESALGGGCLALDTVNATTLTSAIRQLLHHPQQLAALSADAQARTFKSWADYARELTAWMQTLPRRS